jgi:pimeloyl-ACP methyl ester carboxylesterase
MTPEHARSGRVDCYRGPRMHRRALAVVVTLVASASAASAAHAAIAWAPCAHEASLQCATLPVPLDPTGAVPGTINLAVERAVGATNPNNTAIVALAGGPGQALLPLDTDIVDTMKPGLATQDLLMFDQRGTGVSNPLKCNALEDVPSADTLAALNKVIGSCATELGPTRGFFTTAQSVADIEALRVAAGYTKITLFGVSYGTKVAEEYAQTFPATTDGLILDSVVTPTGPDPLNISTYAAIPRVLSDLCANGACNSATPSVDADLAAVLKHTALHPIAGTAVDGAGRKVRLTVSSQDIFGVILSGDLDPTLRAELPAALHGARNSDDAPLLRLVAHSEGLNAIDGDQSGDDGEDEALFLDTTCEESLLPWPATVTDPTQRRVIAKAAIAALPSTDFAPFTRNDALRSQSITLCLGWPAPAAPPPTLTR